MQMEFSRVVRCTDMGIGTRVEIDLVDSLNDDEGILVGDKARGFVCVLAENRQTSTYPPRPFRVNAGAIHQYVYVGDNETRYLSELRSGDSVVVTNGINERMVKIGRVKIERREFVCIELENGITATLQNADSIFISGDKTAIHLCDISEKDIVGSVIMQNQARHIGKAIEEEIIEK